MDELRKRIEDLQKKIEEKNRISGRLKELDNQRGEIITRLSILNSKRIREQDDVDKLEHKGLTSFALRLTGNYGERLDKEKKEAYAALMKYEAAKRELEGVEYDIQVQKEKYEGLRECEEEYRKVLEEKERIIEESGSNAASDIEFMREQMISLEFAKTEIEEAVDAGRGVIVRADKVISELDSAENWGVFDILAGDFITTLVKHSKIDEAQTSMEELQVAIRRFQTEIEDVERVDMELEIDCSDMLRFADLFFDGLIVDFMVQKRLEDSSEKVRKVRSQVSDILGRLNDAWEETDERISELKREIEKKVILS